jgi:hypothetical protein
MAQQQAILNLNLSVVWCKIHSQILWNLLQLLKCGLQKTFALTSLTKKGKKHRNT